MRSTQVYNRFTGVGAVSDGTTVGVSESWPGGRLSIVTLDNPGAASCVMERRESGVAGARWCRVGGVTWKSAQRFNLFTAGFDFRVVIVQAGALAVRLTLRSPDQASNELPVEPLITELARGELQGFIDPEPQGIVGYGDYEALRATHAPLFFCYDEDPQKLAEFGGSWERYGTDYRKMHVNSRQYLLSTAIANYTGGGSTGGGGGGGGGGGAPAVGSPPKAWSGSATLAAPPSVNIVITGLAAELYWGDATDEDATSKYEVALNGTVVYVGRANYFQVSQLEPSTDYTLSVVHFKGEAFSAPSAATGRTAAAAGGGTAPPPGSGDLNPPINLVVSAAGDFSLQVFFGFPIDASGVTKYGVWVNDVRLFSVTGGYALVSSLDPDTTYRVGITSENDSGQTSAIVYGDDLITTPAVGGGGGSQPPPPPVTPENDGALTTSAFAVIDAYPRTYVEAGSSGQTWGQASSESGFSGQGYLVTSNVDASPGQGAIAFFLNQPESLTADRTVWLRIKADVAGDLVQATSAGTGVLGSVVATTTGWHWARLTTVWKQYDRTINLVGRSGNVLVDKILVMGIADTTVPTGVQGLRLE